MQSVDLAIDLTDSLAEIAQLLREAPPLGDWVMDAACAGMGEVFTSGQPGPGEMAVMARVCRRCPVRDACAEYASSTTVEGFWGGEWQVTAHALRARRRRARLAA